MARCKPTPRCEEVQAFMSELSMLCKNCIFELDSWRLNQAGWIWTTHSIRNEHFQLARLLKLIWWNRNQPQQKQKLIPPVKRSGPKAKRLQLQEKLQTGRKSHLRCSPKLPHVQKLGWLFTDSSTAWCWKVRWSNDGTTNSKIIQL